MDNAWLIERLPWWLRRCHCRSYNRRTGKHVEQCPRRGKHPSNLQWLADHIQAIRWTLLVIIFMLTLCAGYFLGQWLFGSPW